MSVHKVKVVDAAPCFTLQALNVALQAPSGFCGGLFPCCCCTSLRCLYVGTLPSNATDYHHHAHTTLLRFSPLSPRIVKSTLHVSQLLTKGSNLSFVVSYGQCSAVHDWAGIQGRPSTGQVLRRDRQMLTMCWVGYSMDREHHLVGLGGFAVALELVLRKRQPLLELSHAQLQGAMAVVLGA